MTIAEPIDRARDAAPPALTTTTREKLRQLVARIETLNAEKAERVGAIRDVYAEARAVGFDAKGAARCDPHPQTAAPGARRAGARAGSIPARAGRDLMAPETMLDVRNRMRAREALNRCQAAIMTLQRRVDHLSGQGLADFASALACHSELLQATEEMLGGNVVSHALVQTEAPAP